MLFWDLEVGSHGLTTQNNMAQNMNAQQKALLREIYEQDGLSGVRQFAKWITPWCKEITEQEKRGLEEQKLQEAETKKLNGLKKAAGMTGKALIKELRKNETFKQMKTQIADAEKAARKAAADAKKLAAAEAKANKPTKASKAWGRFFDKSVKQTEKQAKVAAAQLKALVSLKKKAVAKALKEADAAAKKQAAEAKPSKADAAMIKRWSKVLGKGIKLGEADTKKALAQLKKLTKAKKAADAKAKKAADKAAKAAEPKPKKSKKKAVEEAAVGDDLIATLLAKASAPPAAPAAPEAPLALEQVDNGQLNPANAWAELEAEAEEADEEEVKVVRFEHAGVKYLKDTDGYLYDPDTQEEVGFWDGAEVQELEEYADE